MRFIASKPALRPSGVAVCRSMSLWSPESVLEPLNAASEPWLRSIVWWDFRLAVALFVAVLVGIPLAGTDP